MLLSVAVLAVLAFSSGQAARTYWLDPNCPALVRSKIFPDAKAMANNALTFRNDQNEAHAAAVSALFSGASTQETEVIFAALQDFADATEVPNGGHVRIYCDDDQHWIIAPDDEFPGNSDLGEDNQAWWDPVDNNNLLFYLGDGNGKKQRPGCKDHDGTTRAQTYCDLAPIDSRTKGDLCRVTLCNQYLPERTDQTIKYFSFDNVRLGKDLSKRKGADDGFRKPTVDDYRMTSLTILHEWMHTIHNPYQFLDKAGARSYGWKNIRAMGKAESLQNADSVAYVGLTAHIINRGLTDTPTKTYKFDAKDGFITS